MIELLAYVFGCLLLGFVFLALAFCALLLLLAIKDMWEAFRRLKNEND